MTKPTIVTWQGTSRPSLESVRLLVSDGRLRASGRLVVAGGPAGPFPSEQAYSASFEFTVARTGNVGRGLLRTTTAESEQQVSVGRTEDGMWLIDHGKGAERNEFDGAIDVDVAGAVTFSSLPIRRLGLHREAGEHELPVIYISMPDLSVSLLRQTYRTVSITDDGAVINYTDWNRTADITVDREGVPINYPGIAGRV